EPVYLVTAGELAAAVGAVDLQEFGEDPLRRNLENLDWVAQKANAHNAVITAVACGGPVVPVRMATVYLGDARVHHMLDQRYHDLRTTLGRLTGKSEMGVKVLADPKQLMTPVADQPEAEKLSGTAYLMRRKRALASREQAYQVAA